MGWVNEACLWGWVGGGGKRWINKEGGGGGERKNKPSSETKSKYEIKHEGIP